MTKFRIGEWDVFLSPNSHPRELMVEVTMRCNYDCIHCFRRKLMNESYGEMDIDLFKELLKQAIKANIRKLVFSGWGEPLIHSDIIYMIELSKNRGFEVLLNTNGSLLREYASDIVKLGVDEVVVSIDAVETDLYKALRIGGMLSDIVDGLLKLKDEIVKLSVWKPVVSIQFTLNNYNYGDLLKLVDFAKKVGVTNIIISNVIPLSSTLEIEMSCYMNKECLREVEKAKYVLVRESLNSNVYISLPNFNVVSDRRCPFVSRYASYVRWDGGIAPCIYYAHTWSNAFMGVDRIIYAVVFGNIMDDDDVLNIWGKAEYSEFRFRTYMFHMPSCLDCPLVNYCDYTLSNRADCWGNEPTCSHCPYSHDIVRCPL